jgi:hypothetical protein
MNHKSYSNQRRHMLGIAVTIVERVLASGVLIMLTFDALL